jgi:hypothetical protein
MYGMRLLAHPSMQLPSRPETVRSANCPSNQAAADSALVVWSRIREALAIVRASDTSTMLFATRLDYRRTRDAGDTTFRQRAWYAAGLIGKDWSSPAAVAHAQGYVRLTGPDSLSLLRPSIALLIDPSFTEDHCFSIESDSSGGRALAFGPRPERARLPELKGRFRIGLEPPEVREVEFSYINVPGLGGTAPGGTATFEQSSRTADRFITRWRMREQNGSEEGSELLLVEAGDDTIWRHQPVRLDVRVTDSASHKPGTEVRIRLDGASSEVAVDSMGVAAFPLVPVGNHGIVLRAGDREKRVAVTLVEPVTQLSVALAGMASQATITFSGTVRNAKTRRGIRTRKSYC